MDQIIQCVPNFSEGRDEEIIESIVRPFQQKDKVYFVDYQDDPDYNRVVVSVLGEKNAVLEAMVEAARAAVRGIDMRHHHGQHHRMGAIDVVPIVPIKNITMEEAVEASKELGQRIYEETNIPVYFYENSATSPERKDLSKIRQGEFEAFEEKIQEEKWKPDIGEAVVHPTAGVVAIGARPPLIAFNVELNTGNVEIAKEIARNVRHSSGGLRFIKALGVTMGERHTTQVSMNVVDYKKNPLYRVLEMIKMEAKRYGVEVIRTEIVGSIPMDAVLNSLSYYLQTEDLHPEMIIESQLMD